MKKYAEKRDDLVIATRGDPAEADIPSAVKASIESESPDVTVSLKNIDDLGSI